MPGNRSSCEKGHDRANTENSASYHGLHLTARSEAYQKIPEIPLRSLQETLVLFKLNTSLCFWAVSVACPGSILFLSYPHAFLEVSGTSNVSLEHIWDNVLGRLLDIHSTRDVWKISTNSSRLLLLATGLKLESVYLITNIFSMSVIQASAETFSSRKNDS